MSRVRIALWLISLTLIGVYGQEEYPMEYQPDLIADFVILVDSSNSTVQTNPTGARTWTPGMLDFIRYLNSAFRLGNNAMRVGMIVYSDTVKDNISFSASSGDLVTNMNMNVPEASTGGRRTDLGLVELLRFFNSSGRPGVLKRALLVTDGVSLSPDKTKKEAEAVRDFGVDLVALAIGDSDEMKRELEDVASSSVYSIPTITSISGSTLSTFYNILHRLGAMPIHGGWTDYSGWSSCSAPCGIGTRARSRTCTNPPALYGGSPCVGEGTETEECIEDPCPGSLPCPIDERWSEWSRWSSCSVTCGAGGVEMRMRECEHPAPQVNGRGCQGKGFETRVCNSDVTSVDGGWSNFQRVGACSATCGTGIEIWQRQCTNPAPEHGGRNCSGSNIEQRSCNTDGIWDDWSPWSQCSVTCGQGNQQRVRACTGGANGNPCVGESSQVQKCILPVCGGTGVEAACFIKTPSVRVSGGDLEIYIDYESLSQPGTRWMRATEELTDVNKYAIIDQKIENTKYQSKLQILSDSLTLVQMVESLPKPEIQWTKNGGSLTDSQRYTIGIQKDSSGPDIYKVTLKINNPNNQDVGLYSLQASNLIGISKTYFTLNTISTTPKIVKVEPPQLTEPPTSYYNRDDELLTITVQYQSDLEAEVTLLKDGNPIPYSEGRHLLQETASGNQHSATLRIRVRIQFVPSLSANYVTSDCRATGSFFRVADFTCQIF
ncbi:hypothetical protein ScPMuIL_011124 [Solemya velum]